MPGKGNVYFWIVAILTVGLSIASAYNVRNYYPFYPGTMYLDAQTGEDFYNFRTYCTDHQGHQFSVTEIDLWYQERYYYIYLWDVAWNIDPPTEKTRNVCLQDLKPFVLDTKNYCQKLTVYRQYWKKFSGPLVKNPTQEDFMCELSVENARKL